MEAALFSALRASSALGSLARYDDGPAVFARSAPSDYSTWPGAQFPRCTFAIDWQYSPQRVRSGALRCEILSLNQSGIASPQEIATALSGELNDSFLSDDGVTYGIRWARTESYTRPVDAEPECLAAQVTFDILPYQMPDLPEPNPVCAIADWLEMLLPQAVIIGRDELSGLFHPTRNAPAVFVRIDSTGCAVKPSASCVWLDAGLAIHFVSPDWTHCALSISHALACAEYVTASDGSPVFIRNLRLSSGADSQSSGQLAFTARYGVLPEQASAPILQSAYVCNGSFTLPLPRD